MIGDSLILGRYFPIESALHRLDPRVKLLMVLAFITALFFIDQMSVMLATALIVPALLGLSKLPFHRLARALKPLIFILGFTLFIHLFLTPGTALFRLGPLVGTETGLERGIFFGWRLVLIVTVSSFITLTTTPVKLTDAVESMLRPLKKLGLPVHEFAFMTTRALRFIPTVLAEAEDIIKAQKARGADFETGNYFHRARSIAPVLVPLFIGAFRRSDDLAVAMEARGYVGGEGRTNFHELRLRRTDYLWLAAGILVIDSFLLADKIIVFRLPRI
jgi:energy-coupling factor transport system permease protein